MFPFKDRNKLPFIERTEDGYLIDAILVNYFKKKFNIDLREINLEVFLKDEVMVDHIYTLHREYLRETNPSVLSKIFSAGNLIEIFLVPLTIIFSLWLVGVSKDQLLVFEGIYFLGWLAGKFSRFIDS